MRLTIIVILLILFITSCNNCKDDDCPSNIRFEYELVNASGENLYAIENNNYTEDNLKVIGFKGTKEVLLFSKLIGKNISFEVAPQYDSVQVIYNDNHKDTFIAKNLKYRDFECCGSLVDNFDIEKNGQDFCNSCSGKTWTIQK